MGDSPERQSHREALSKGKQPHRQVSRNVLRYSGGVSLPLQLVKLGTTPNESSVQCRDRHIIALSTIGLSK